MKPKAYLLPFLALLCILVVAADLRLFRVGLVPGWYNDEGTYINLAANLLQGRSEYFGVQGSMLFSTRMPLFIWLLTLAFQLFGVDITVLRALTAGIGIINTALIYLILQKWSRPAALVCALVFAIFPRAVLYARIGFSYNWLAMLVLLLFWASSHYLDTGQRRYAAAGALALGLGLLSDLAAVAYIPVFVIVVLWKRWKDLWFALPLAFLPLFLYCAASFIAFPQTFGADLQYAVLRVSSVSLPIQFVMVLINSASIHQDLWMLAGAIGLFLFPYSGLNKRLVLFLFLPLIILARTLPVGLLGRHYLIPSYPIYAIGLGLLVFHFSKAAFHLSQQVFDQVMARVRICLPHIAHRFVLPGIKLTFVILLVIAPIVFLVYTTHLQILENNYTTDIDPILADPAEARTIIGFLSENTNPDDLVIASPTIAWALPGNPTDYHISLAYMNLSTTFFSNDLPQDRFRFDPSYQNAKFIIIDNLWLNWGEPNLEDLAGIRHFAEQYPVTFKTEHITIYNVRDQ